MLSSVFLLFMSLVFVPGCGHDGSNSNLFSTNSSNPAAAPTATVVVRSALLPRAIPAEVTSLRFTGRDSAGSVVFGPETQPKAAEIRLQVPITVSRLHIDYLVGSQLVGVYSTPLQLVAGQVVTLQDPNFTAVTELEELTVRPQQAVVTVGLTHPFTAEGRFSGGTVHDVTLAAAWSSSNPDVATVNAQGVVSGLRPGSAVITASLSGKQATGQVRVTAARLQSLSITPVAPSLAGHATRQFTATGTYSDGVQENLTGQVSWSSSAANVAVISPSGLATGVSAGSSTIQASLQGVTDNTTLRVQPTSGKVLGNRNYGSGGESVAIGDFDGRNGLDIVSGFQQSTNIQVLLNKGDGTYNDPVKYTVPGGQFSVVGVTVADFDHRNGPDIATANFGDQSISVFFNNGDGTFAAPVRLASGSQLADITSGDFDGANGPDLVALDQGTNSALFYFNQGNGTFAASVSHFAGPSATDLAAGDLDGANGLDLAVTQQLQNQVFVLFNQGGGTFAIATDKTYTTNSAPFSVAIGDLDGQNGNDMAVSCAGSNVVTVLYNEGSQTFTRSDVQATSTPTAIAIGQLDGQGGLDIATTNASQGGTNFVTALLFNNGSRTFKPAETLASGNFSSALAVADLDGHNGADLAIGHFGVEVALNQGGGNFYPFATYAAGFDVSNGGVAAADLDGKNGPDAVIVGQTQLAVLLNNGTGTLATPVSYPLGGGGGSEFGAVVVADFDDKTGLDVAAINRNGLAVFLNNGDGTLKPAVQYAVSGNPTALTVGNFDGKNGPDLAVVGTQANQVSILTNKGDGTFSAVVTVPTQQPISVVSANFDGQNGDDLAVGTISPHNDVQILLSQPDGSFGSPTNIPTSVGPFALGVGNFDGVNGPDLAVALLDGNSYAILLNQGNGSFAAPVSQALNAFAFSVTSGDFNADGKDDLVASGSSLSILLDPLNALSTTNSNVYGQYTFNSAVADFNRDGLLDVAALLDTKLGIMLGQP